MTTKDALHRLIDELPEDQADLAQVLLEDLSNAADDGGAPLDSEALEALDRGLADISAGRVTTLDRYKHDRGL